MSNELFDDFKSSAQESVESLMGNIFDYQVEKAINSPTLTRIAGNEPAGNLSAAQIAAGQTGKPQPLGSGNSNGDLSNSVTSKNSSMMKYLIPAAVVGGILALYLVLRRK